MEEFAGDNGGEATPEPIPNSEVKFPCADGTARATVWESRTLPALNLKAPADCKISPGLFFVLKMVTSPFYIFSDPLLFKPHEKHDAKGVFQQPHVTLFPLSIP